ncbi:hypothetical protein LOK49_LG07G00293 [Camellia lanceoleosa]|uniref:Uncharacterized protein n=1 Tax=Camellia lanceoleosa TaxID=1840588 RepID=A0ACC0H106_9ERIC|nr:hypothetical protein LOK49_LG07G00293 [Camellia lanceoleosa]
MGIMRGSWHWPHKRWRSTLRKARRTAPVEGGQPQRKQRGNGYYQEFAQESKGWSSGGGKSSSGAAHNNSVSLGSWDDWDQKDNRKEESSTKGVASSN